MSNKRNQTAAAARQTYRADPKRPRHPDCQNCGEMLRGDYCFVCGQAADEPRRAVIGLVQDFLIDTLAIDGKLFRTLRLLLHKPGVLARRYLDGKRATYSGPFRLYLFTSVFFFFAFFLTFDFNGAIADGARQDAPEAAGPADPQEGAAPDAAPDARDGGDPTGPPDFDETLGGGQEGGAVDVEAIVEEALRSAEAARREAEAEAEVVAGGSEGFDGKPWEDLDYSGPAVLEPFVRKLYEAGVRAADDPRLFIAQSRENVPRAMLLAPVGYALILLVLYVYRRRFLVYDHFVVSLYMHAALYAYLLIAIILTKVPGVGSLLTVPVVVWAWLQPAAVLRQAYGSNWVSVVLKWSVSILVYVAILSLIITFGVSLALYQS